MGSRRLLKLKTKERIAIISDGTCDTAEGYVRAILSQFHKANHELLRFPKIRDEIQLKAALSKLEPPFLIAYTFAKETLRKQMWAECKERNLLGVDILYPVINIFSDFLKIQPTESEGALHSTDAKDYFERIEALEFAVKHDDGMKLGSLHEADLILTGVSRTSKTPTSMYLAHKGYRVANVPLVPGIHTPDQLLKANELGVPVFCLVIDPQHLARIRKSRELRLGAASDTYSNISKIMEELDSAQQLARKRHWPIIDVTNKAVEETSAEILLLLTTKDS